MLRIKIIAMGKLTEDFYRDACAVYIKRMSKMYQLTVVEPKPENLPRDPSAGDISRALEREAERIIGEIPERSAVVALCVEGKQLSSEELSQRLAAYAGGGISEICFIIGSSHGLHDSVKSRADLRLSMSKMTFPHELFRVMLCEQLYRAGEIAAGGKYHK